MNRLTRIASALFVALVFIVLAACTATDPRLEDESTIPAALAELAGPARAEPFVIVSGADVTLAADESVDLFFVYNGTARIEGHASSVVVVNGTANLVGGSAGNVIAIQSQVSVDPSSVVAGDIRTIESSVTGVSATTVTGAVRDIGLDMFVSWRNLGALALIYIAFAVSAVMAGLVLAGLAGRQVRAAGALIVKEPVMVLAAGVLGLAALLTVGILAVVTIVGIPFAVGLLGIALPGLFVIGYIVTGIWLGELILAQSSRAARERPYLAAILGLTIIGLISFLPSIGGLISFVGFGAVMLLSWRVLRGAPGAVPAAAGNASVARAAS